MSGRLGARELMALVLDDGSYVSWDQPVIRGDVGPAYAEDIERAREKSGVDESVLTGVGTIRGRRVAVLASEFAFLAGSIGLDAAERLTSAIERATAEGLPLLAATASGGTRMQEGTVAFVQMVQITAAICQHKAAGLPYLVYQRHPTTGGVMASWASLGHVTVAEPGALIGFLGPRVYEALYGEPFPQGVQTAENLYTHGLVDAVLPPEALEEFLHRALQLLCAPRGAGAGAGASALAGPQAPEPTGPTDPWTAVTASRNPARPGLRRLLRYAASDVIPLSGTDESETHPGLLLAFARFGDAPCVLLGQDRREHIATHPLGPEALREARRGMRLADELSLPLVTVIDTPGAALSVEAEEGGLAGEIARCLADMVTLSAPTLTVILGQGAGGGALALLPADLVVAAQNGWLSPLPPEGASAIVHRTTDRAADMAREQGVGALNLSKHGIVDRIVAEHPDAAQEPEEFCRRLGAVIEAELAALWMRDADERLALRRTRFRTMAGRRT